MDHPGIHAITIPIRIEYARRREPLRGSDRQAFALDRHQRLMQSGGFEAAPALAQNQSEMSGD